jgi:hypothetical protein
MGSQQVQINIDAEVYTRLQELMVPPISDANAVIRELLFHEGHGSRAAISLAAAEQHFTLDDELRRAQSGVYDCGGCT